MKIAYYVEQGIEQLILTPENEGEKKMLAILDKPSNIEIHKGSFYHCQGGWTRQGSEEESRIIVMSSHPSLKKEVYQDNA